MTNSYYNPTPIPPHTPATAEAISLEFQRIAAGFEQLPAPTSIGIGGGQPNFTWYAYADSADGTQNFTTGAGGTRSYVGVATNRTVATESDNPLDYTWTRYRGTDGTNGTTGDYFEVRFLRAFAPPATPAGDDPVGWFVQTPNGNETLWMSKVLKNSVGQAIEVWSQPADITGPVGRGDYSATTTYYPSNFVGMNGGTYAARVVTNGNAPTGTAQANAWWDVVAAPGVAGEPAVPPSGFTATINLTSTTTGLNLRTLADAAGFTGLSDATLTFRVPSGVTVMGLNTGGISIDTGTWPTSSYTIALALEVQSGGYVYGGGGKGGDGGSFNDSQPGNAGGDAIYCRSPITITVDAGGFVYAGGGGGGGGNGTFSGGWEFFTNYGGGGGGGGAPNGLGGEPGYGDSNGNPGTAGTVGSPGSGGTGGNNGGAGSGFGTAGIAGSSAGGAGGWAIRKNGHTVPTTLNGTVSGTVG